MVKTESKLVRSVLGAYGFHEVHPNSAEFNLMWTGAHLKPFSLRNLHDFQKVNHFPRSYEITRKDRLYKNIERMAHTKGAKHFDFIPKSYLMPSEYQEFCAAYVKEKGSWIVKPIASSRGRGIYLINNPNQVPLEDNIMVCKYISNPLLIDGFKFDVRVYVAITSYDPLLIYLFEEGLTRFATVKYEKTNKQLKNQMMHLTNYSINKKSHDYVRCEDPDVEDYGNKWSMSAMLRYLKQEGIDTSTLMSRIEAVIIKSILAAELPIATACKMFVPHKDNCVELYGFDILIDENLKPWILEGNLSPSLACDAPLDLKIKSSMVADFFSIAGFRCIDPMSRRQTKKQMDLIQRPYSAQRSSSTGGTASRGSKRPSSAGYKDVAAGVSKGGLSAEESRVLTMAKEQYQRRGSFVRIFPTVETWEMYGSFLEYKTNLNRMLAQKLFPERAKPIHGAYSAAVARIRSMNPSQILESRHHMISERFIQYERKLFSLESHKKRRTSSATRKKSKHSETPVGIDNKLKKRTSKSRQSSSEEENEDDGEESEQELESETATSSKKIKTNLKQGSSLSSGDAGSASQPTKQETTASGEKPPKTKLSSTGKTPKTEQSSGSSTITAFARKQNQTAATTKYTKPGKIATKSAPSQRVYMYKSSSPVESVAAPSDKQSESVEIKSVAKTSSSSSDSTLTTPTSLSSEGSKALSSASASSLSLEIAKKIAGINQKQTTIKTARNQSAVDVLAVLKSGGNLGKLQARQAFSAYLSRVQHRLRMESEGHVQEITDAVYKQEEQMDLVLRFLKRAAGNLCQSFSVVVPSRRLPIIDRKRILSKQLAEFVRIYNKESDSMEHKQHLGMDKDVSARGNDPGAEDKSVADGDFRSFISNASESSLEEVLTAYTHKNKSASVFLGASKAKKISTRFFDKEEPSGALESPSSNMLAQQHNTSYGVSTASTSSLNTSSPYYPHNDDCKETTPHSSMSSLQQAAYIYSAKTPGVNQSASTRRPASAKPFMASGNLYSASQSSIRPGSASNRPLSGSIHYQTAANQEAISDALQRLTERQAARQYSASVQLTALSKHLSNLNLANMNSSHHHKMGSGDLRHMSAPQRTSSLCDLASVDPSVQSMVDPGLQKFGQGSDDSLHEQNDRLAMQTLHESLYSNSTQMLSQQSNVLLQQSKAKHQAMLAQMLNEWRDRQQAELRSDEFVQDTYHSSFCPSNYRDDYNVCNYFPYPAAGVDDSLMKCLGSDQGVEAVDGESVCSCDNLKDALLIERTEKLINSTLPESETFTQDNIFLKRVLSSSKKRVPKPVKVAWTAATEQTTPERKRKKLVKSKPKQPVQSKSKHLTSNKTSVTSKQKSAEGNGPSQPATDSHRSSETVRNIFYYENILKEINSLFKMGALPADQCQHNNKHKKK